MKLYNLTSFELLWERERDTKALMAWNDDTVVLAFRGTASLRNVLADIQVRVLQPGRWHVQHSMLRECALADTTAVCCSWHPASLSLMSSQPRIYVRSGALCSMIAAAHNRDGHTHNIDTCTRFIPPAGVAAAASAYTRQGPAVHQAIRPRRLPAVLDEREHQRPHRLRSAAHRVRDGGQGPPRESPRDRCSSAAVEPQRNPV